MNVLNKLSEQAIVCDETHHVFTLHTKNTSYQMKADAYGVLLHTYYGPRIRGGDLSCLIRYTDRGFSMNPDEAGTDRTYSLDTLPQEYSGSGAGDFRLPSLELDLPDGSHVADLRYTGFEILAGKYSLEGLPAFYGGQDEAGTLVIRLEDKPAHVGVELYYGVFPRYDLITRAVRVINQGESPVRLRRCASLCLDFQHASLDLITFDGRHVMERVPHRAPLRHGVQAIGSVRGMSGHQHNPFVILCDRTAGEGQGLCYGAMLLYSGNFEAAAERSQFEDSRLVMGIHPFHFSWTLDGGESFTAPEAAMVCSPNGFGPMSRQFHRAIRDHLLRDPYAGRRKPVLINSWEAAYCDFNDELLLRMAREAAGLGAELFVLDDGWFGHRDNDDSSLGDWQANEAKLPGGLKALSGRLRELGLDFGLWIEPEMVSEDSDLYRAHPDWTLTVPGRPYTRGRNQLMLDFTRPEVREHIFRSIKASLEGTDVRYIKWDMNRALAQVWSSSLPPERQGEVYHRYVLGVYDLLERFRREWPELLLEGCAGGGGRFDAGMLYYTPQIWCSDNTDAIDRLTIQYGTSFAYPPCTMGSHVSVAPNHQNGRVTPLDTRGAVALSGAFGYELDPQKLSPEEKKAVARQIEAYKSLWRLPARGDYYRLTPPGGAHTAWEHVSEDRREALACLVTEKLCAAPPFRVLKLQGLDPAARYRINGGEELWPGDLLMLAGYPLPMFSGDYQSLQLHLTAE